MHGREAVRAAIEAARKGESARVFSGDTAPSHARAGLINLNNKAIVEFKSPEDTGSSPTKPNLNNLKRGGVPRLRLYTDPALQKAIAWGVEEWLIQVSIREYGEYAVKAQINRLHQIPEGYFKPQYGPVPQQRGRLFNREMQKLRDSRQAPPGATGRP